MTLDVDAKWQKGVNSQKGGFAIKKNTATECNKILANTLVSVNQQNFNMLQLLYKLINTTELRNSFISVSNI